MEKLETIHIVLYFSYTSVAVLMLGWIWFKDRKNANEKNTEE